jgi:hypothetical protein
VVFLLAGVQGRLTQLAAASVGMVCPNGLPADLSGLSALQTLDLAFNNLNSTTDRLAQVRVFLHLDIQCSMTGLTVLWVWSVSTACLLTCLACQPSRPSTSPSTV